MALTAARYHFANVTGIDISGEVLPQHPNDWQVNRGEDLAFLIEACGERLAIREKIEEYAQRTSSQMIPTSEAEARVKRSLLHGPAWEGPLSVTDRFNEWEVLWELYNRVLKAGTGEPGWSCMWSKDVPHEREWSDDPGMYPYDLFPEMYPSALGPILPRQRDDMPYPWTVDLVRAALSDLKARQWCFVPQANWFDEPSHISKETTSFSGERDVGGWVASWESEPEKEFPWFIKTVPTRIRNMVVPPELGTDGKMITRWTSAVDGQPTRWRLRVTHPAEDFEEAMEMYMPDSGRLRSVVGTIVGYIVEARNMRTYLESGA